MKQDWRPASTPETGGADEDFELLHALRNIRRYPALFWSIIVLCVTVGALYAVTVQPRYKADALVQIDQQQGSALGALADVSNALQLGVNPVDGELDIIKSRATIYPAIEQLGAETEIQVDSRFPLFGRLYARYRQDDGLADPLFGLTKFAWGGEQLKIKTFDLPNFANEAKFYIVTLPGDAWKLSDDDNNVLASGRVGEVVRFPVDMGRGKRAEASIQITGVIAHPGTRFLIVKHSRATVFRKILKRFEATQTTRDSSTVLIAYVDTDPVFAADLVNAAAAAYVKLNIAHRAEQAQLSLAFLTKKLPEIRKRVDDAETRLNQYRIKAKMIDIDGQTQALLDQAAELAKARAQADVAAQSQAQLFRSGAPAMRLQDAQVRALSQQQSVLDDRLRALPMAQQEFVRLSLDVDVNTSLYTALLENEQQLEVMDAGTTGNVFVAEYAEPPELASWPRIELILGASLVIGLVVAFVAVQMRATLLGAVKDPLDIERATNLPLLAVIPKSEIQEKEHRAFLLSGRRKMPLLLSHTHSHDRAIEAIRSLRSAIKFLPSTGDKRVLLFSGPTPGVGKSFVSTNFAFLLANSGKRVVLMDCDMRRSSIAEYVQVGNGPGLAEVLMGQVPAEKAIRQNLVPGLDVLPAAAQPPKHPSELLESAAFGILMEQLRARYDYVVIDSPPVLPVSDTLWIARHADLLLMVARAEVTNPRHLIDALARLANVGAPVAGQIFNGFEPRQAGYGYSYGYEYYTAESN